MQQSCKVGASIIIPTLNEVENLKELLPGLFRPDREVIVCDNGSADGTVRLVEDAMASFNVRISKGTGSVVDAVLRGIKEARCDKIIVMDGDGSHTPEVVSRMVDSLDKCDIVIGSRFIKGGGSRDTLKNRFISKGFNLLAFFLAPRIKDRASGFWGLRRNLVDTPIRCTTKPMLEYLVRSSHNSVREVPYIFLPRISGESKIGRSPTTVLKELYSLVLLYIYKFQKPIKFCIVGGSGVGINLGILLFLTEVFHVWYFFSAVVAIFIVAVWNYIFHNFWTFKNKKLL